MVQENVSCGTDGSGAVGRSGGVEIDDALRVGDGKRAQEHRVHDAEDGGVGSDAQSKREDGGEGEAGTLAHGAQAEAEIAEEAIQPGPAAVEVEALLSGTDIAESATSLEGSFVGRDAFLAKIVGFKLEVGADFFGKIGFAAATAMEHDQTSSFRGAAALRIRAMASVSRFHWEVFSAS